MTGKRALASLSTLWLVACGGAAQDAKPSQTPSPEPVGEPQSVEEAQDRIVRARVSLESANAPAEAPAKSADSARSESAPQGGAAREEKKPAEACGNRCRALASMKRAVDALCRMTGDADTRCIDARQTLRQSTTFVASCKCEG